MMTKENYIKLLNTGKTYGDMTAEEQLLCYQYESEMYLPIIEKLRSNGVEDYKISAYLQDLYDEYLVCDDMHIANEAGISDDDYEKGREYRRYEMDEKNPLIED